MLLVQVCVAELGKDRLAISSPMTTERWDQVRLWRTVKPGDAVEDHCSSGRLIRTLQVAEYLIWWLGFNDRIINVAKVMNGST